MQHSVRNLVLAILVILVVSLPIGRHAPAGAVRLAAAAPTGHFKVFRIPSANSQPRHIAAGSDGNTWFTESNINAAKIGRIDAGGNVTEFVLPNQSAQPDDIVSGPDGALWFTGPSGFPDFFIGRITTDGKEITGFAPPCDPAGGCSIVPGGIASGPDGNIWFTEDVRNAIVRLTPAGVFTFFTIPTQSANPQGITRGPDNALWFAEQNANKIGRIDTIGNIVEFGGLTGSPSRITLGPDGNLWFTELFDSKIGSITVNGLVSEFQTTAQSQPSDIVAGPDGNLWFTKFNTEFLSQITPAGVVTDVVKARGGPFGIGRTADGALWVALMSGNKLGRFSLR